MHVVNFIVDFINVIVSVDVMIFVNYLVDFVADDIIYHLALDEIFSRYQEKEKYVQESNQWVSHRCYIVPWCGGF